MRRRILAVMADKGNIIAISVFMVCVAFATMLRTPFFASLFLILCSGAIIYIIVRSCRVYKYPVPEKISEVKLGEDMLGKVLFFIEAVVGILLVFSLLTLVIYIFYQQVIL